MATVSKFSLEFIDEALLLTDSGVTQVVTVRSNHSHKSYKRADTLLKISENKSITLKGSVLNG